MDFKIMMYGEKFDIYHCKSDTELYLCFTKKGDIVWKVAIDDFETKEKGYAFAERLIDATIEFDE